MNKPCGIILVAATIALTFLGGSLSAYATVNDTEIMVLLRKVPPKAHGSTWPEDKGFVRYDTLRRSGDYLFGRYANTLSEACSGSNQITSMPDEKSWKTPVKGHNCAGADIVLEVELKLAK